MTAFLLESPKSHLIPGDEIAVSTATYAVEHETGFALLNQKWSEVLDTWPSDLMVTLHRRPVQSLMVRVYPPTQIRQRRAEAGQFRPQESRPFVPKAVDSEQGIVWLPAVCLDVHLRPFGGIEITYVAGFGSSPSDVPDHFRTAVERRVQFRRSA